ncbi:MULTISPECIES: hypothetical protein [Methylobacterium]|uniref:hypothetical protein n=1 Tax=Methylobacterium TaxID=407 RepID=UPI0019CFD4A3|nr:hypothetical protein [Methylobacterium sp. DB0501]
MIAAFARTGLRRIARGAGLACLPVLVWLSWIPKDWETRTGAAGQVEHLVAYAGTALLLGIGFHRAPAWRLGLALGVLAAVLEIGQIRVPGRTAQGIDVVASAAGALAGLCAARIVGRTAAHFLAARVLSGRPLAGRRITAGPWT